MYLSLNERLHYAHWPKRLSVRRGRSRTAAESIFCGLDVNLSLSQPTKCIPLTPHNPPSSRYYRQYRMRELGSNGRWNQHTKPSYDGKSYMLLYLVCGATAVSKHQIQPEYGDEQTDAGRDCRTRLATSNSQALTRTGKSSYFLFS